MTPDIYMYFSQISWLLVLFTTFYILVLNTFSVWFVFVTAMVLLSFQVFAGGITFFLNNNNFSRKK